MQNATACSPCTWSVSGGVFTDFSNLTLATAGSTIKVKWNSNFTSGTLTAKNSAGTTVATKSVSLAVLDEIIVNYNPVPPVSCGNQNNINIAVNTELSFGVDPATAIYATGIELVSISSGWQLISIYRSGTYQYTATVKPSINTAGQVTLRLFKNCPVGGKITGNSITANISRSPLTVGSATSNVLLCANSSQTISATSSNATTMNWVANNGFSISNISNTINGNILTSTATITAPNSETTGTITATPSSPACGNGTPKIINTRSIGLAPSAGLLSASGAGMTVTQGGLSLAAIYNGSLISFVPNGELINAVEWQSGSSSVYVSSSGITATAYPSTGCVGGTATILVRVKNCTGNWSNWKPFTVNVCSFSGFNFVYSPNPTSDKLDITAEPTEDNKTFAIASSIDFEVKLIDKDGKVVREGKNLNKEKKITLDVKGLKEGTYFLHILHGKEAVAAAIEKHQILISK